MFAYGPLIEVSVVVCAVVLETYVGRGKIYVRTYRTAVTLEIVDRLLTADNALVYENSRCQ